jgi:hypothetical protein
VEHLYFCIARFSLPPALPASPKFLRCSLSVFHSRLRGLCLGGVKKKSKSGVFAEPKKASPAF